MELRILGVWGGSRFFEDCEPRETKKENHETDERNAAKSLRDIS